MSRYATTGEQKLAAIMQHVPSNVLAKEILRRAGSIRGALAIVRSAHMHPSDARDAREVLHAVATAWDMPADSMVDPSDLGKNQCSYHPQRVAFTVLMRDVARHSPKSIGHHLCKPIASIYQYIFDHKNTMIRDAAYMAKFAKAQQIFTLSLAK